MVVTCAAILAVDFPVFPRRFAKVETWGTSLMDLGVGSFVFSAGVVAARPILKQQLTSAPKNIITRLRTAFRHAIPLFILGLVRLYSVKSLDYAEHVTEYGVHWNFFFTLAMIPPLVAVFDNLFIYFPSYSLLALVVGVFYQIALDSTTLTEYILTAPRSDLLSKNREGIFSSFGYLSIFLAGQGVGTIVLPRHTTSKSLIHQGIVPKLVIWTALWGVLFFACTHYRLAGLSVSRRISNLPYILGVNAFNSAQIMIFCLIEAYAFPDLYDNRQSESMAARKRTEASSRLLRSFNRNGLAVFLIANLLTGAVNLTLPTLEMSNVASMGVLLIYMGIVSGVALGLDKLDMSIKL